MVICLVGRDVKLNEKIGKIFQYLTIPKNARTMDLDEWTETLFTYADDIVDDKEKYWPIKNIYSNLRTFVKVLTNNAPDDKSLNNMWNRWILSIDEGNGSVKEYIHNSVDSAMGVIKYLELPPESYTLINSDLTTSELNMEINRLLTQYLHEKIWINGLFSQYTKNETEKYPNWIITDVASIVDYQNIKSYMDSINEEVIFIRVGDTTYDFVEDDETGEVETIETWLGIDNMFEYVFSDDSDNSNLLLDVVKYLKSKESLKKLFLINP